MIWCWMEGREGETESVDRRSVRACQACVIVESVHHCSHMTASVGSA